MKFLPDEIAGDDWANGVVSFAHSILSQRGVITETARAIPLGVGLPDELTFFLCFQCTPLFDEWRVSPSSAFLMSVEVVVLHTPR